MDEQRITGIEPQKKNPNRVNVYLDHRFAFGLYKAVAFHLKIGDLLGEKEIHALQQEETSEDAYQHALKLLSYRPRSEHEVRTRLVENGFSNTTIDAVIATLMEKGYLNDQQFALDWIENRSTFRPRGKRLLRMELMKKHVDERTIQSTLDALPDEEQLIHAAARKYLSRLKGLDENGFKKKLYGFLMRRGFSYEDIKPVLSEMWEENARLNSKENEVLENE
jgi:regulatory protein